MNVVIWARVSSREQREGYSIDAQLRANRERADKNGWKILREFVVAESAKRGVERTAFNEMFAWVKANAKRQKIGAILAHKLDRVCRNMRDAVRLQELEDGCGVELAFVENQFGPGAAGALSFNVMAAVAQYYSDNLRGEVLKGIDEKVRQGWPSGLAPYGYINVADKNEPVQPHPVESKAVVRIFELFAGGRYTIERLRNQLGNEGFLFRPSQPRFTRTGLSYILNNRFYIGELARNGTVHAGKYRLLIDPATFKACQDVLQDRNRRLATTNAHLFSGGLLRCATCNYSMTFEVVRRTRKDGTIREHPYYRCANNVRTADHRTVRWRQVDLEDAVRDDLASLRMPDEIATWFRTAIGAAFDDVGSLQAQRQQALTKRHSELVQMQDRLLNCHLQGTIDEPTFAAKAVDLKRQVIEVQASLERVNVIDPQGPGRALATFDFSQQLAASWDGSNFETKREILECVSLNGTVSDTSLALAKRKPFSYLAELKNGRGERI